MLENKFWGFKNKNNYTDKEFLIQDLKSGKSAAILFVQEKAKPSAIYLLQQSNLPADLLQEALNESTIILLKKLREPNFELLQAKPTTYLVEICRRVVSNMTRKRHFLNHQPLENQQELRDLDTETFFKRREDIEVLTKLLTELGDPCSKVIQLKHLEGYSDEEVVSEKLVAYSTVESLRMKRSDCMKKLKELAIKHKNVTGI